MIRVGKEAGWFGTALFGKQARAVLTCLLAVGVVFPPVCRAEDSQAFKPRRDPFVGPVLVPSRDREDRVEVEKELAEPPPFFELRAVLVFNEGGLASINGVIVRQGEEILGHRLLHVREDRVVLEKKGKQVVLSFEDGD